MCHACYIHGRGGMTEDELCLASWCGAAFTAWFCLRYNIGDPGMFIFPFGVFTATWFLVSSFCVHPMIAKLRRRRRKSD